MQVDEQSWELRFGTVIPVWVFSVVATALIWFLAPAPTFLTWLSLALSGSILLTFCIQLSLQLKDGFVQRSMASIGGSLLVYLIGAGIFSLLSFLAG